MTATTATSRIPAKALAFGTSVSALAMMIATPALAQDAPAAAPAADTAPEAATDIVVTGSRIKSNGFEERAPATVISSVQMNNLAQVNVSETLAIIPQNQSFQSDTNAGPSNGSRASSNIGASYANLRGLNPFYGTRTLTLVNSRRFVPTSDSGAVDVNMIPTALIARVETVTGGASAAYGSDAIAGVVNIILDQKFKGVKAQADYGQTFRSDGRSLHASAAAGTSFGGGRGHIVVSGEYQKNKQVGDCSEVRAWCAASWDVFSNAGITVNGVASGYNVAGSPTFGQPNFIVGPNSKQAYQVATGVIRNAAPAPVAVRNRQFNDAGTALVPFDPGLYVQTAQTGPRQGGDGDSTYTNSSLRTPITRYTFYTHGTYELADDLNATVELSYGSRKASATGISSGPRSTLVIPNDNAFIPAAVRAQLGGNGLTLGKSLDNQFANINTARAQTWRGLVALDGKLGFGNWSWDAYYQYGRNKRHQSLSRSRVNSFFEFALDSVINPANGQATCRAVLQNNPAAAGCVPINLFGSNTLTQAGIDYAWREAIEDFRYDQHVVAGTVQGDLFAGVGAGPFALATGVEYRSDKGNVTHGNVPYYDQFALSFGLDYSGKISVLEGFAELNAPLLRDSPLGNFLELNGAARYTRTTSTNGFTSTSRQTQTVSWKASLVYEPADIVRFRATRSRDIRAAGFRELFLRQQPTDPLTAQGRVNNPYTANAVDQTPILGGGAFTLKPEKANTTTAGAVLSPLRGLRLSADWYQIRLKDAVTTPSGQQIINFCFQLEAFCDRITFNPAVSGRRDITFIDSTQLNLGSYTSRGVDMELDYTLPLNQISGGWDGKVNFRVVGTYQYDLLIRAVPGAPVINFAGQTGPSAPLGDFNPAPKWLVNSIVTYDQGPFTGTVQVRYVGPGALNKTLIGPDDPRYSPQLLNSISNNRVKSATYVTAGATWRIPLGPNRQKIELFGVIDNLFDKDPPVAPGSTGSVVQSSYPTNPAFFDTLGRRFRAGARFQF